MTSPISGFESQQNRAARLIAAANWAHPPVVATLGWFAGTDVLTALLLSLALAGLAEAALRLPGASGRPLLAMAVIAQPAMMIGALAGHPWQLDMHMHFFALLAALVALTDVRAIVGATAVVAVHHLAFALAAPALVFPLDQQASAVDAIGRVLIHAVILLIEAGVLIAVVTQRHRAHAAIETEAAATRAAEAAAREADARAERERRETLAVLEAEFAALVDRGAAGDFGARITARFDEPVFARLADGLNDLFARTDQVLGALEAQLTALARGDLTGEMRAGDSGRFRTCRDRMNESIASLRGLVSGVAEAVARARDAAARIRGESEGLSGRAGQQAAAVEETAAALEEISATVASNADLLEGVERMARGAADKTARGETSARRTVDAVSRIEDSSKKITEIIALIEGIAFQTNLLALNAAVEAARAGEAGRGFAVVASEVRTLSQRTSEAAASVTGLIRESADAVGEGVRMVQDTGAALGEIAASVNGMIDSVGQVAMTGREQATGVAEVGTAVSRIDAATQANAAAAQSAADAAADLAGMVDELERLVGTFAIDGRGAQRMRLAG
jgi:methyl-accepting chemotaxis protein